MIYLYTYRKICLISNIPQLYLVKQINYDKLISKLIRLSTKKFWDNFKANQKVIFLIKSRKMFGKICWKNKYYW